MQSEVLYVSVHRMMHFVCEAAEVTYRQDCDMTLPTRQAEHDGVPMLHLAREHDMADRALMARSRIPRPRGRIGAVPDAYMRINANVWEPITDAGPLSNARPDPGYRGRKTRIGSLQQQWQPQLRRSKTKSLSSTRSTTTSTPWNGTTSSFTSTPWNGTTSSFTRHYRRLAQAHLAQQRQ